MFDILNLFGTMFMIKLESFIYGLIAGLRNDILFVRCQSLNYLIILVIALINGYICELFVEFIFGLSEYESYRSILSVCIVLGILYHIAKHLGADGFFINVVFIVRNCMTTVYKNLMYIVIIAFLPFFW